MWKIYLSMFRKKTIYVCITILSICLITQFILISILNYINLNIDNSINSAENLTISIKIKNDSVIKKEIENMHGIKSIEPVFESFNAILDSNENIIVDSFKTSDEFIHTDLKIGEVIVPSNFNLDIGEKLIVNYNKEKYELIIKDVYKNDRLKKIYIHPQFYFINTYLIEYSIFVKDFNLREKIISELQEIDCEIVNYRENVQDSMNFLMINKIFKFSIPIIVLVITFILYLMIKNMLFDDKSKIIFLKKLGYTNKNIIKIYFNFNSVINLLSFVCSIFLSAVFITIVNLFTKYNIRIFMNFKMYLIYLFFATIVIMFSTILSVSKLKINRY